MLTAMPSALIIRAHLPPAIEAIRRKHVADAARGLPAHLTLLSPFASEKKLQPALRQQIAAVIARHTAFDYHLVGPKTSSDTIYAGVDSERPFLELYGDLAAAFPEYPLYERRNVEVTPHVTVAGGRTPDKRILADRAWHVLPTRRRAYAVELIAPGRDRRWATVWRFRLPTID
jgi:2'-5' RNA ligase